MSAAMPQLTLDLIAEATDFLSGRIRRTPLEPSPALSSKLGVPVWLKLESLQITGSFKIRGAFFRMSRLSEAERRTGIVTCSAGNHGKACAYAGRELGVKVTIYVPKGVDEAKHRGMLALGAEVKVSEFPGFDETEEWAQEEARKSGRPFLSAFDDVDVMAGNGGTMAKEIVEDLPDARDFIVPVGGGGLGAGFSFYLKEAAPRARFIAVQHEVSPGLKVSLEQGRAATRMPSGETLAAGIEGGIGAQTFEILRRRVDHVALINDAQICDAMRWLLEEHQYLIEPTAAATLAACLNGKAGELRGPAVVILSGRNVSGATIRKILCS
ncbi:MAG: pyridoxal-phosphate dependent enzyme [Candidatus Acidiferrales bacterium]